MDAITANTHFPWRKLGWCLVALALAIPAIGNFVSPHVDWTSGDFAVWALMLLTLMATVELVARVVRSRMGRWLGATAAFGMFLLVWAELATGGMSRALGF